MGSKKKLTLHRFWVIWSFVEAALLIVAGIVAIVFGILNRNEASTTIEAAVAYALGAFVIMGSVIRLVKMLANYTSDKADLMNMVLFSGIEMALGITIIITEATYGNFIFTIASFISVMLMVAGLYFLLFSIVNIARHISRLTMPIVAILFGAILIGVGTAIMILYHQTENSKVVLILIGSVMVSAGATMAIIAIIANRKKKKADRVGKHIVEEPVEEIAKPEPKNEIVVAEETETEK